MPSKPVSPPLVTRPWMSTKVDDVETLSSFWKTRTTPFCSTTNQRVASPGACSSATGELNVRPGKGRATLITAGGGGDGEGFGAGAAPPPPPPHEANTRQPKPKAPDSTGRRNMR